MEELVKNMGIHRRSIYLTFGNKHDLYLKTLRHYRDTVEADMEEEIRSIRSVKAGLKTLLEKAIYKDPASWPNIYTIHLPG